MVTVQPDGLNPLIAPGLPLSSLHFRDFEVDLRYLTEKPVADLSDGRQGDEYWIVHRPAVQPLLVEHIFPTHGQFADWECNLPIPDYVMRAHP